MARVMARYVDGMVVRTYGQAIVDELAGYSSVPVINALTDLHHPCQVLSDIMTVIEHKGRWQISMSPGWATATTWPIPGSRPPPVSALP